MPAWDGSSSKKPLCPLMAENLTILLNIFTSHELPASIVKCYYFLFHKV